MQNSSLLLEQKNAVDMSILYKSITYNMMTDEQKEVTRLQVKELEGQKEKLDEDVKKMRGMVRGLTTPSLPPPPQVNAPQAVHTISDPNPQLLDTSPMPTVAVQNQSHHVPMQPHSMPGK